MRIGLFAHRWILQNKGVEEFERLGTTLLYVSNKSDYKETNLITDNIYVMRNGNVVTYVQK